MPLASGGRAPGSRGAGGWGAVEAVHGGGEKHRLEGHPRWPRCGGWSNTLGKRPLVQNKSHISPAAGNAQDTVFRAVSL